jgi:hypothetical protein
MQRQKTILLIGLTLAAVCILVAGHKWSAGDLRRPATATPAPVTARIQKETKAVLSRNRSTSRHDSQLSGTMHVSTDVKDDSTSAERALAALLDAAPNAPGTHQLISQRQMAGAPPGELLIEPRSSRDGKHIYCTAGMSGKTFEITPTGELIAPVNPDDVPAAAGTDAGENPDGEHVRTSAPAGSIPDEQLQADANAVAAYTIDGKAYVRLTPGGEAKLLRGEPEDRYIRAVLSPDHRLAALVSPHTGIHIVDTGTGSSVANLGDGTDVQWLPAGDGVIYRWWQPDESGRPVVGDVYLASANEAWMVSNLTRSAHEVEQDVFVGGSGNSVLYSVNGAIYAGQLK